MTLVRSPSPVLLLLLVASASLSACAGPPDAPPAQAVPLVAAAPGSLDGTYEGTITPDSGNPDCGFETDVGYQVSGTNIQLRTHKMRRELGGTIDPYGRFTMTSTDGSRQVVGVIQNRTLTASETTPPQRHRHSAGEPVAGGICTAHITASHIAATPAQ